jgi:oligoribonuclease (3'-5' exoribonuclease)
MSENFLPEYLVMVDAEMTGVVPKRDKLLQVAMVKLKLQGNQYVEYDRPLVLYFQHEGEPQNDFQNEHLSHIFERCNEATLQPGEAKEAICQWLGELKGKVTPCGDCVPTDIHFLKEKGCIDEPDIGDDGPIPGTFHYEYFDMNGIKALARHKAGKKEDVKEMAGYDEENVHDALVDCRNQTIEFNHHLKTLLEIEKAGSVEASRAEAAPTPSDFASRKFYHGTSDQKRAEGIWKDGILPDLSTTPETNISRPVAGRVYLATNVKESIPYVLGGAMAGSEIPKEWIDKSRYGYLFVVSGASLGDIQPDEDQVGQAVHDRAFPWVEDYLKVLRAEIPEEADEEEDEEGNLIPQDDPYRYHDNLLAQIDSGEYAAWIKAGHVLLETLTDEEKMDVINRYGNVAHQGKVLPIEMWQFDKKLSEKLKPNGSNFFKLAKRVEKRSEKAETNIPPSATEFPQAAPDPHPGNPIARMALGPIASAVAIDPEVVIKHLLEHDGSGDEDFLEGLKEQIRAYPEWEMTQVNPKTLDIGACSPNWEVVKEYQEQGPEEAPAIIAVPQEGGKPSILDGCHRACAAEKAKQKIWVYMPKKTRSRASFNIEAAAKRKRPRMELPDSVLPTPMDDFALDDAKRAAVLGFEGKAQGCVTFEDFQDLLSAVLLDLQLTEEYRRSIAGILNRTRQDKGLELL